MATTPAAPRHERRAAVLAARRTRHDRLRAQARNGAGRLRKLAFGGVVLGVLAIGAALAFGDFLDRPSGDSAGVIEVQSSMAGFTPSVITVKAGSDVTLHWWTDDAAMHLTGGVHTMISDELGLHEELRAESDRNVAWTVPNKPGTYDVWCDSCCGGEGNPVMHGKIVIEPASAA
jgi:cytochrome c oxidase subunit II